MLGEYQDSGASFFEAPGRLWFRMFDADPSRDGCLSVSRREAESWNRKGYGIFSTVNLFSGGVRRIASLSAVASWAVDLDAGTKEEQWKRLIDGPLWPSAIVETKRGFQAYWHAADGKPEHWNALVLGRLVPHYGADRNARDLARILRVPGFLHQKDPANPFRVRLVHEMSTRYTEIQIAEHYHPAPATREEVRAATQKAKLAHLAEVRERGGEPGPDGFWERAAALDCRYALEKLSGSSAVSGERYSFRRNQNGNFNIVVNGKGTSCWIDANGRIGSLSGGGPVIASWLKWMGMSYRDIAEVLKRTFPELTR